MGFCYRYMTVEGKGARAESYALLDFSSPLSALSDDFARRLKAPWLAGTKAQVGGTQAVGWTTKCPVVFNRTDVRITEVEFVVLPKRVVGEDVILGRQVAETVGEAKLLAIRYKCDQCRESLFTCEHGKRKVETLR